MPSEETEEGEFVERVARAIYEAPAYSRYPRQPWGEDAPGHLEFDREQYRIMARAALSQHPEPRQAGELVEKLRQIDKIGSCDASPESKLEAIGDVLGEALYPEPRQGERGYVPPKTGERDPIRPKCDGCGHYCKLHGPRGCHVPGCECERSPSVEPSARPA